MWYNQIDPNQTCGTALTKYHKVFKPTSYVSINKDKKEKKSNISNNFKRENIYIKKQHIGTHSISGTEQELGRAKGQPLPGKCKSSAGRKIKKCQI